MAVTFGEKIYIEIYGESHAERVGVKIEGLPAGKRIDLQKLQQFLERRAPGRNAWSTQRKEPDVPVFLSGVRQKGAAVETDGTILEAVIENTDVRPDDYENTATVPRPGHVDYPAWVKYGRIASGGGAFSARMTAPLCVAGRIFLQWLEETGVKINARIASIGGIENAGAEFPEAMKDLIARTKEAGDSIGGIIECEITGLPAGVGSPLFGNIESRICQAVFAVPAVKGIEFGEGFAAANMKGSENNDPYCIEDGQVRTKTNHHGGILGGLSSGMPIVFRTAMKPTPSIALEQDSVDLKQMTETKLQVKGRHDPCIVPRALPCIEAAAAIAIGDLLMEEGRFTGAVAIEEKKSGTGTSESDLSACRDRIDAIDRELVELLEERFDVARDVIRYKERYGLPILDSNRESELLDGIEGLCKEETKAHIRADFEAILAESRAFQQEHRHVFGLLGKNLTHSHSPQVHKLLGGYEYGVFDRTEEQLDAFMSSGTFRGISVTIPYKRAVIPYCSEISNRAAACRSVNTIVRREDGTLYGDNTDYTGFRYTIETSGIDINGAKTLVLGSGGVSGTVINVLKDLGADPIINISRKGENNYDNLDRHADAEIIVNATPVGMFPDVGVAPIDLVLFPQCRAVFDVIYNPLRTQLMLDAEARGIPAFGGLVMLVAQAAEAARLFTGRPVPEERTRKVIEIMRKGLQHIVLIGMPGSGKTTIGKILAQKTGRTFVDLDEAIQDATGRTPEDIIRSEGEGVFRTIETETLKQILRDPARQNTAKGFVLATGGGIVERDENRDILRANGYVVYLKRPLEELPADNRPITQTDGLAAIYERRQDRYTAWSDVEINNQEEFG